MNSDFNSSFDILFNEIEIKIGFLIGRIILFLIKIKKRCIF